MYKANENRYAQMKYARCGKSGLLLPRISLGLWHNFGSVDPFENQKKLLFTAFDLGITHFDLANNYGPVPGSAEENFGRIISAELKSHRDELVISTKAGYEMWDGPYGNWGSRKYLMSSLDQSLSRMKLDYVDIFYHHRPDPDTPLEETMGALADIVHQGKALYAGISNYNAEQTKKAAEILRSMGVPLLINQFRYNMIDRWADDDRLFDALDEVGSGSIAFCPLAQGLLTSRYLGGIPEGSRATRSVFLTPDRITDELRAKLNRLNEIAKNRGQSLAEMSLSWALRRGRLTSVLIGASRAEQIVENARVINAPDLTDDELSAIHSVLA
ncbi:aldo/keto reductase [Treponema saccharophilum]|uniref:Aldo/keto reductase n=1 Tax=Treponema saccharophilum DSM 2985 TaxID=907348 RepID=H7ELM6_9SPIR|nr:aldo/keto reductase [Treponema saccharophilum]EIC01567.1 aldo/keto reductase [Treponema saccharophilum DSM 2985]BDC95527.1 glyceraldehyde 3-phosphate reductase [Treponema saccharophilum]